MGQTLHWHGGALAAMRLIHCPAAPSVRQGSRVNTGWQSIAAFPLRTLSWEGGGCSGLGWGSGMPVFGSQLPPLTSFQMRVSDLTSVSFPFLFWKWDKKLHKRCFSYPHVPHPQEIVIMWHDRGADYAYDGNHMAVYTCTTSMCWTP